MGTRLVSTGPNINWGNYFNSSSPVELLRTRPNYTDLQAMALRRKQQIMLEAQQRATQEAQMQPLKQQLEQQRIEHEAAATLSAGAAARYKHEKEMQTMQDQVGFLNHMESAPASGTPEYHKHLLSGVNQFPGILGTDYGKEVLSELAQKHDTIQSLTSQLPKGFEPTTIEIGGGKQSHVTARRTGLEDSEKIAKELFEHHKITPSEFLNADAKVQYGSVNGTGTDAKFIPDADGRTGGKIAQIDTGEGKPPVRMMASEYSRYKTALTPTVPTATADVSSAGTTPSLDFYTAGDRPYTPAERAEYIKRSNARLATEMSGESATVAPITAPATAPPVDMKALAQQALDDPAATEAHKAAARSVLGK